MGESQGSIKTFQDLHSWQASHDVEQIDDNHRALLLSQAQITHKLIVGLTKATVKRKT